MCGCWSDHKDSKNREEMRAGKRRELPESGSPRPPAARGSRSKGISGSSPGSRGLQVESGVVLRAR